MLTKFIRFMPQSGIQIYPNIVYRDANDIDYNTRNLVRLVFETDPEYVGLRTRINFVSYTPIYGREFCTYVYKGTELLGNLVYKEITNNPHGYGHNDFLVAKRVLPEFRRTKYSRYMAGDMIHMMFKSGLAKRLYTYVIKRNDAPDEGTYWEVADFSQPCAGEQFTTDGPSVQKYISIKRRFPTSLLMEFNGDVYNSMDLLKYFTATVGRTEDMAKQWIAEMDFAAEKVRETYGCFNDKCLRK